MNELIKQILPLLIIFSMLALFWVIKMLIDRQLNAKKAEGNVIIFELPVAGVFKYNNMCPIEQVGGRDCIRYPRTSQNENDWPIHFLSDHSAMPVDYPAGKGKFVQARMQAYTFVGDDIEPLSPRDIPTISRQLVTNVIEGVATSLSSVMNKQMEEGGLGKSKKAGGLLWVYIIDVIIILAIGASIFLSAKNSGMVETFFNLWKSVVGIK